MKKNKENKYISWKITDGCNYNCAYCFIKEKSSQNDNYKETIKKLSRLKGIWRIMITGGEPFYCKNFKNIIQKIIKETRHEIEILTNFSPQEKEIIEIINIAKKRLKNMSLSLHLEYTTPKEFLEKIQKIKKYFNKYEIHIVVNCVAVKKDLKKRTEIGRLFQKNGISFVLIPDKKCFNKENYYSKEEKKIINKFGMNFGFLSTNFKNKMCSAGKNYFVIDEKGDAYRCYPEMFFQSQKKSIGKYNDKKFNLYNKIRRCPYPNCDCETPYFMDLISDSKKKKLSLKLNYFNLKTFFIYLIHTPERLLGKLGIFLRKHNQNLYHKLKKIEKKIRR